MSTSVHYLYKCVHSNEKNVTFAIDMTVHVPYLSGLATAFYIATSIAFAAVRWFHMCRPYDKDPDYYYPGRRVVTFTSLSALLLLPYALNPYNPANWLIVKAYYLPVELYFLTIMLFSYFGNVMEWQNWKRPALWAGIPGMAGLVLAPLLAGLFQRWEIGSIPLANAVILALGAVMTVICLWSIWKVWRWAKGVNDEEYSNPHDFPVVFARRNVYRMLLTILFLWVAVLSDSRAVMAVLQLFLSAFSLILLIGVLHPHRHPPVEEPSPAEPAPEETLTTEDTATSFYNRTLSESKALTILSAISEVVVEQQAYLDPHLTIQDVADRAGYSRTYIAGLFKTELGGFFHFINTLRLEYADKYQQEHPDAPLTEVISEAGFASRTTYYSVKARLQKEA